jgi:hypothetical protein
VNGYFGPSGRPGALRFYPVVPCRVADTRNSDGVFGGPEMEGGTTRSFAIPAGSARPLVSTLNSWGGTVVANAAIVPAGSDGAISIYVTNRTHVILDINGYFAPQALAPPGGAGQGPEWPHRLVL